MKKLIASKRLTIVLVVLLVAGAAGFLVISRLGNEPDPSANPGTGLDVQISRYERSIDESPDMLASYVALSGLYLQKVRETADTSYYGKVDALLDRADAVEPGSAEILSIRASVAQGRHRFKEAKELIDRAIAASPGRAAFYGVRGDAEIELGRYDDAVASFQEMADIRPDFSAYSRIAYVRELYGDVGGAKEALMQAIESGSSYAENVAWANVELGKLALRDDPDAADARFARALALVPGYAPAIQGQGRAAFARGDLDGAARRFDEAFAALPLAQHATDRGDVALVRGDRVAAAQQFALARAAFAQSASSGVDTDLEEALFLADHDLDLPQALEKARRAWADRPSVYAADYLAWALFKSDKADEAAGFEQEALRLGEHDPLILFHQGMIALGRGDRAKALRYLGRAEALSPHFSVQHAGTLREELGKLRQART